MENSTHTNTTWKTIHHMLLEKGTYRRMHLSKNIKPDLLRIESFLFIY